MKLSRTLIAPVLLLCIGAILGYAISIALSEKKAEERREVHLGSSASGLTNPLLDCNLGREYLSEHSIRPFRDVIKKAIESLIAEKKATNVSYYFRDLNNGSWFGFNEKEEFSPASLFKLPLLVYTLRQADINPSLLGKRVAYPNKIINLNQFISSQRELEVGKDYSVRELLEYMISNSDNNATAILLAFMGSEKSRAVFQDLGIAWLPSVDGAGRISVRDYATFFRVLYNASYLSKQSSEDALLLLTKSEFKVGIVAGVPANVPVAHKFGERGSDSVKQLHDCGIVYAGKNPYLLCVMTRGDDFTKLAEVIAELSRISYEAVEAQAD